MKVDVYDKNNFSLVVSRADDPNLWSPYESSDNGILIAIAGRIALDSNQWEEARKVGGTGGLACKAIYQSYQSQGPKSLESLNGHYVVIVFDRNTQKCYLAVDRCGMVPCFYLDTLETPPAFSSHPDVLATVCGFSKDWDEISMAEFVLTGKVSYPHTYYNKIKSADFGSLHTIDMRADSSLGKTKKKCFPFEYKINSACNEWSLAEQLATAFRKAVTRRTLPLFGKTGISLSGGLDSRAILCSTEPADHIVTFCFFDEENREYSIAKAIAKKKNVQLIPLKRNFEYYGETAEMGIRICGGMGSIFNNHFLGFRTRFKELGIENLITGFYCDYFFKALALDRTKNRWTQRETLANFGYEWYRPIYWLKTPLSDQVKDRLNSIFTTDLRNDKSQAGPLRITEKRLFPLSYEPDHAETTIPQRVLSWYLPTVDNDIMNVYQTIPPQYKLNTSMYSKMVQLLCGKEISQITNINTGAPVNASFVRVLFQRYLSALHHRLEKKYKPTIALSGSWPNWEYYIRHSQVLQGFWNRKSPDAAEFAAKLLGTDPFQRAPSQYQQREVDLFSRLLTIKIWIEQRTGMGDFER